MKDGPHYHHDRTGVAGRYHRRRQEDRVPLDEGSLRRSAMKVCPECKGKYSDTVTLCPKDGSALVPGEAIEPRKILLGIGFVIGAFLVGGLWLSLAVAV